MARKKREVLSMEEPKNEVKFLTKEEMLTIDNNMEKINCLKKEQEKLKKDEEIIKLKSKLLEKERELLLSTLPVAESQTKTVVDKIQKLILKQQEELKELAKKIGVPEGFKWGWNPFTGEVKISEREGTV